MGRRQTLSTVLLAAVQAATTACGGDPTTPPPTPSRKPSMVIVSGNGQAAEVGTALVAPLVVQVLDGLNAPAKGVVVRFRSANSPARDSTTTDSQGVASVRWTVDTVASTQEILAEALVYAAISGGSASATFRATATAGVPARVALTGGDGAVAAPNTRVDTVIARAIDRYGNASPAAQVDWLVRAGGGTVRPITTRTDDRGSAQAIWIMGPSEGLNALDVTVGAITGHATATASITFPGKQVVVGETHSCALTPSGVAYCWGANSSGQLGLGRTDDTFNTSPQRVAGGLTFVSLVAGAGHTCGLTADSAAYCWGNGREGQLGIGSVGLAAAPTRVAGGLTFQTLAAGAHHTCGLTTGRSIYCWGDNTVGQLGDAVDRPIGPAGSRDHPVLITAGGAPAFLDIGAGSLSTCAIAINGGTYCWGANTLRELGGDLPGRCAVIGTQMFYDGTTPVPCSASPVRLSIAPLTSIAVSKSGWCGVTTVARLVCWGNSFEQPRFVLDVQVTAAWVVGFDVCAQENVDAVTCWGVWGGRVGFPVVRPFGDEVRLAKLASGVLHSCGVSTDGRNAVHCWGDNSSGQLGDGTSVRRPLPIAVLSPRLN